MPFTPIGLGRLLVDALRSAVKDPELQAKADRAEEGLATLNTRVEELVADLGENDALDTDQTAELEGIRTELQGLADALSEGILEEVEPVQPPVDEPAV